MSISILAILMSCACSLICAWHPAVHIRVAGIMTSHDISGPHLFRYSLLDSAHNLATMPTTMRQKYMGDVHGPLHLTSESSYELSSDEFGGLDMPKGFLEDGTFVGQGCNCSKLGFSGPRHKCIVLECWMRAFSSVSVLSSFELGCSRGSRVGFKPPLLSDTLWLRASVSVATEGLRISSPCRSRATESWERPASTDCR